MEFPTVLSKRMYRHTKNSYISQVICDNSHYQEMSPNLIEIKGNPGFKTVCEVLVYIAPSHCRTWARPEAVAKYHAFLLAAPKPMFGSGNKQIPQLSNFRSGCFTILVGHGKVGIEPILYNWFTELDLPYAGTSVTVRTNLFVIVQKTTKGFLEIYGIFMLIPPIATMRKLTETGDILNQLMLLRNIFYGFARLNWITLHSPEQIENKLFQLVYKQEIIWFEICMHCVHKSKVPVSVGSKCLRQWRGSPDQEQILVSLLFPNSSFIPGIGATVGLVTGYRPQLIRHTFPGNLTLLFKPLTEGDGNHFLTCFAATDVGLFSIRGLISAFDSSTWIWFFVTLILFPAFLLSRIVQRNLSDIILNSLSVLLEQGFFGRISKWPRWISGVWLLMSIILTNVYKGDNIKSLTAPRTKARLEKFDQLFQRNFTYYVSFQFSNLFVHLSNELPVGNVSEILPRNEFLDGIIMTLIKETMFNALNGNFKSATGDVVNTVFRGITWPKSFRAMFNWSDSRAYLPLLEKCGKQAYVGYRREVFIMAQRLSSILLRSGKTKQVVSISKESFSHIAPAWQLQGVPLPSAHFFMRVHLLWQSGLIDMWDAWSQRIETWNSTRDNAVSSHWAKRPKKLTLGDNVVVVFYLYLALVAVPVVTFFKEALVNKLALLFIKICDVIHILGITAVSTWFSITRMRARKFQTVPALTIVNSPI